VKREAITILRALGTTDYVDAWKAMQAFTAARDASTPMNCGLPVTRRSTP